MQTLMMKRSRPVFWLGVFALMVLTLLGQGCGSNGEAVNPNILKNPPATWISLSPSTTELMSLMNSKLIGRTASDNFPHACLQVPVVASVKPNYELIAKLKPDAIILDASVYNGTDMAKLKELNVPILEVTGDTVDDYLKSLFTIASQMKSEMNVNEYAIQVRAARAAALGDAFTAPHNVALLMVSPNSNPMIAGTGSFYDDVIRSAGGTPVGPTGNQFTTIDPEALLKLNPDLIVVAAGGGDYNILLKDPRFSGLAAVKDRHVVGVDPDLILRRGQRVQTAITMLHEAMGSLLKNH